MTDDTMKEKTAPPIPEEKKALAKALVAAQGEFPLIPKDKTANAGSYSYAYADLGSILAIIRPILSKHGLAIIQPLEAPNGKEAVRTELWHADGGVRAASFPLGEWSTPQQRGSLITYTRRQALTSMLGIAAEEDDDGRQVAATGSPHEASATKQAEESPFQPPDLPEEPDRGAEDLTSAQRRKIFAVKTKLTNAGLFDDEQFKAQLVLAFGVDSVGGLTKEQASDLIERLLKREEEVDEGDTG